MATTAERVPVPEVDPWVAAVQADVTAEVAEDPRYPAGTVVVGLRMYDTTEGVPWAGWALGLVGLPTDADDPYGPVWSATAHRRDGTAEHVGALQVWHLLAGPRGSRCQVAMQWRPGMDRPQAVLLGWDQGSTRQVARVVDGGRALLLRIRRRGPLGLADEQLYGRLCGAWARVAARTGGGARQADLAAELGKGERTVRTWIKRVEAGGYPWPPGEK